MKRLLAAAGIVALLYGGTASAKVIGRVNGYPITERSANNFLKVVTKGKLKYRQLRLRDKKDVVKRIATDALLVGMAKRKLSEQERNQILVNYWLAQKTRHIKVDPAEIKKAYTENKKFFKDPKGNILPYEKVKEMIAVSIRQKKYVADLMKKAKITMNGKVIKAPEGKRKASSKSKTKSGASNTRKGIYVVQSGNTLSGIAHKYHITMDKLRAMNKMGKKDVLKVGQKLKVPVQ